MKRLHFLFVCLLLSALSLVCAAAEGDYIVYLRQEDSALLAAKDGRPAYTVVDADELAALEAEDKVLWYEEDIELFLLGSVGFSDPYYAQKWDLAVIDAQRAWNEGYMGDDIIIGVVDSGVQPDHPDLAVNLLPSVCYLDGVSAETDTFGHGTFVAGMLAAAGNGIGTVGVAPKAKIQPLKCFESGVKTTVSMAAPAILDAVDKYGCRILNLSFGAPKASQTLKDAIDYAIGKGCIVVAAVGNDGNAELNYPAAYPGVIGVGSVNASKAVSSFSQRNESVKLVAPGEQVVSTYTGSRYGSWEGTSFAAPLVSGAAALLLGADDTLGPGEMSALLTRSAVRLGEETYSTSYGYGLLNIGRALRSLADISGDLDCDGAVTMRDALLLLRAILHADSLADITVADMNGDGTLTLVDVLLLLRAAAM
jgi:peptidase S8 and S53 subtilisin kexin sedolisin